jgi:5-methylcytosine-specific restriction endonuclease McrA
MQELRTRTTLVLDGAHRPTGCESVIKSIKKIVLGKAVSLLDATGILGSERLSMPIPSVVLVYGAVVVPTKKFSRLNVLYRDNQRCVYCGTFRQVNELTVDHIIPDSRWEEFIKNQALQNKLRAYLGSVQIPDRKTGWLNCVAACARCNRKKGHKFAWEAGYRLQSKPFIPKYTPRLVLTWETAEKRGWLPYIEKHNGQIIKLVERE